MNKEKVELDYIDLREDSCGYYFYLVYLKTNDSGTYKITFPCVRLSIIRDEIPNRHSDYFDNTLLDLFRGTPQLLEPGNVYCPDEDGRPVFENGKMIVEVVEETCVELTVPEIEKKLGYKIKIVEGDK